LLSLNPPPKIFATARIIRPINDLKFFIHAKYTHCADQSLALLTDSVARAWCSGECAPVGLARPLPSGIIQRALGNQTPAEFASKGDEGALSRSESRIVRKKA